MTVLQLKMCETDHDEVDRIPSRDRASHWDIAALLISISSHLIDIGLDCNLAYRYYMNEHIFYFIFTLGFILVPAFINTAFSIRMYIQDGTKNIMATQSSRNYRILIIILIFQLAPVLRYIDSLKFAIKSIRAEKNGDFHTQRKYYEMMLKEDSDVALLRVLECFLEAAPQQILQITILLVNYGQGLDNTLTSMLLIHQLLSIISSFVSMAWSMASYHRSVRFVLETKGNISKMGTVMQFMWHFLVTVSRILSISCLASICYRSAVGGLACHWLVMTLWLCVSEKTQFCNNQKCFDIIFFSVFGLVYTFTHVNISDGKTRCKYIFFYTLCFLENIVATFVWMFLAEEIMKNSYYYVPIIVLNIVPFITGIIFMITYYKVFHPSTGMMKSRHKTNASFQVDSCSD